MSLVTRCLAALALSLWLAGQLMDKLRVLERDSKKLADQIQAGQDRAATLPLFVRLDNLRIQAAEDARRMFLAQETIDRIQNSRATFEAMRRYFTGETDTRPGLRGPTRGDD